MHVYPTTLTIVNIRTRLLMTPVLYIWIMNCQLCSVSIKCSRILFGNSTIQLNWHAHNSPQNINTYNYAIKKVSKTKTSAQTPKTQQFPILLRTAACIHKKLEYTVTTL